VAVDKELGGPVRRTTPLAVMIAKGMEGMEDALQFLHRAVWRSALKR
jgi:hypothetical protein